MGQKFAAHDANGIITAYYDNVDSPAPAGATTIEITDAQWQACISAPGWTVTAGALVAPTTPTAAQLLAQAQADQAALLQADCQMAITNGFSSSALGAPHQYPSQPTDQANLASAVAAAQSAPAGWTSGIWCAASGAWSLQPHTAAQLAQVNTDWVTARGALQQKYANLVAKVQAATTVAAVQAITWS